MFYKNIHFFLKNAMKDLSTSIRKIDKYFNFLEKLSEKETEEYNEENINNEEL